MDEIFDSEVADLKVSRAKIAQMDRGAAIREFEAVCDEVMQRMNEADTTHAGRRTLIISVLEMATLAERLGFKFPPIQLCTDRTKNKDITTISLILIDPRGTREKKCPIGGYATDWKTSVVSHARVTNLDNAESYLNLWKLAAHQRGAIVSLSDEGHDDVLRLFLLELEFVRRGEMAAPAPSPPKRTSPIMSKTEIAIVMREDPRTAVKHLQEIGAMIPDGNRWRVDADIVAKSISEITAKAFENFKPAPRAARKQKQK